MSAELERRRQLLARIEEFHGVSLQEVLDDVRYLRDSEDSVIAGGSLAYGFGNHLSDLDLLVAGPSTMDSSPVPIEHFVKSLRVDVWKFAQSLIEEIFDRAERALRDPQPVLGSFGDLHHEDELKLLHRLAYGVLLDGEGLKARQGRDYRAIATGLVMREYAERMRSSAFLAQAALQAGRSVAAVVNARHAVEEALNAVVVQRGLPFSGDKWLRERLETETTDLAAVYERFRQLPDDPVAAAGSFVDGAMAACVDLWGIDLSVELLSKSARWQNSDLRLMEVGEDRLLLSERFGALWSISATEADRWREISPDPDGLVSPADLKDDALSLCVLLHEQGALGLAWGVGIPIEDLECSPSGVA